MLLPHRLLLFEPQKFKFEKHSAGKLILMEQAIGLFKNE